MKVENKAERWERLRAAVKRRDGWWATVFTSKLSIRVVSVLAPTSVTPNHVTAFALVLALLAAYLVYRADNVSLIVAAVLVQLAFVFDCADGQLARFKQMKSDLGGWYDQVADRIREFALIIAATAGYHRLTGDDSIWPLGFLAFFFMWMLEYYSQQNCQIPVPGESDKPSRYHEDDAVDEASATVSRVSATGAEGLDSFEGALDRIFPLAAFRMGEQLLLTSAFLIAAGATGDPVWIKWLILVMVLLGGAHAVYRPLRRLRAYFVGRKRALQSEEAQGTDAG